MKIKELPEDIQRAIEYEAVEFFKVEVPWMAHEEQYHNRDRSKTIVAYEAGAVAWAKRTMELLSALNRITDQHPDNWQSTKAKEAIEKLYKEIRRLA